MSDKPATAGSRALGTLLLIAVGAPLGCVPETPTTPAVADQRPTQARTRNAPDRAACEGTPARELDAQIARATPRAATPEVDAAGIGAIAACVVCHGVNGEGNPALDAPRIGGLDAPYVARQLKHFRTSVRGETDADKYGMQMRAIAISLQDDEVIADLASYFSTLLPPYAAGSTGDGDVARGAELYAVCMACHGADGRGSVELSTPSLVGQYDWYLVRQLQNYRNRLRGANPLDVYGLQMAPIVQATLKTDRDVADVVAYIQSLPTASPAPSAGAQRRTIAQADRTTLAARNVHR